MKPDKRLNLLGLAQVAGKLVSGTTLVEQAIASKQATLVLVSTDAADNVKRQLNNQCRHHHVQYLEVFTKLTMSQALGKKRAVCAFTDAGFRTAFLTADADRKRHEGAATMRDC